MFARLVVMAALTAPPTALVAFPGYRAAVDTSAPVLRLPVFAHRPMGTQF